MLKLHSCITHLRAWIVRATPIVLFALMVAMLTLPVMVLPWERREFIRWWQIELALYPSRVFLNHFRHFLGVGFPFLLAAGLTAFVGVKYCFLVFLIRGETIPRACAAALTTGTLLLAGGVGIVFGYQLMVGAVLPTIPLTIIGGPIAVALTALSLVPLVMHLLQSGRFIGTVVRMIREVPWPVAFAGLWLTSLAIYSWTMVEVIEPGMFLGPPAVVIHFWIAHEVILAFDRRYGTP